MAKIAVPQNNKANEETPSYVEGSEDAKNDDYEHRVYADFKADLDAHDEYITEFDAYEAMLMGKTYDAQSKKTNNGLTDSSTTTIYLERAARVVSQLPTGNYTAAGKKDDGKAALINIVAQKYVYPNANSQAPLLQKLRSWQFYSSVYNYMLMHYDWTVRDDGYVGPDCWLWHPRNFVPPVGYASIDDMPYANAIAYCDASDVDAWLDEDDSAGWDKPMLRDLKAKLLKDNKPADTSEPDSKRDSYITRQRQSTQPRGKFMCVTRYEAGKDGHWVTYAPEYQKGPDGFLRDIPNPHKNGKIPFVKKSCIPTFDNFYDIGDFQRAKPIQFAMDGLTNFYFMGIKRQLLPPMVVNPNGVVKHTVSQEANSIILETIPNSVRDMPVSNGGLNTYQGTMTQFKGSLLNQAGTTDTTASASGALDPGFGKTPQAINSLQQRQSSRDTQDLFYLESAIQTLMERMVGLIATMATETIPIDIFAEDIQDIKDAGYDDILKMLKVSSSGQSAKLHIKPGSLNDMDIRFHLDEGSTVKQSKSEQLQAVQQIGQVFAQNQNFLTQLQAQGKTYDLAQYAQIIGFLADVPELGKIVRPMTDEEKQNYEQSQQQQSNQQIMKLQGNFKDLPPDTQMQVLAADGYPSQNPQAGIQSQQQAQVQQAQASTQPPQQAAPSQQGQAPITVGNMQFNDPAIAQQAQALMAQVGGRT